MFRILIGGMILLSLLGLFYLTTRFHRFFTVRKPAADRRVRSWLLALIPTAALLFFARIDLVNTVIVILHLIVFWIFSDLLGLLLRRWIKREIPFYWQGALAILVTGIYLGIGLFLNFHVWETDYTLSTRKDLGMDRLRIVQISDSHLGTTFGGEGFARHLERIQETQPDLLVITGDYVDDDTTREEMLRATEALGTFESTYGVYFVFGNHDRGYFNHRDFTAAELVEELEKNHVTVLTDETVMLTEHIALIGRRDRSESGRMSAAQLAQDIAPGVYQIVLDHQPHDFAQEAQAGFDLVLCGHTHGGQMFPIGITGELTGANDKTYGLEVRGDTTFIVNSGISDWAILFKTGTFSEYGVIDIFPESASLNQP